MPRGVEPPGQEYSYEEIVRMTEAPPVAGVIDPDAAEFAAPTDMPQAIRAWCAAHGVPRRRTMRR